MTIKHYDLFAGIGGFSLALEEVFTDDSIRHIFCEWESFPTSVLRRHWPGAEFYGDIADLVADTESEGLGRSGSREEYARGNRSTDSFTIVTGGFPCQPFSHAGRRKGTADDRYQWPNMFAVIRNTKPEWVIAENVRGLVTWNDGMVLETVCADLESEGYEVQPFIIPAVAVGAPHRRDRVWIIGRNDSYAAGKRRIDGGHTQPERHLLHDEGAAPEDKPERDRRLRGDSPASQADAGHTVVSPDPDSQRVSDGSREVQSTDGEVPQRDDHAELGDTSRQYPDWSRNWQEVAFATCDDSMDDGLSRLVDGVPMSRSKWRQNSLKAYGNGIVPEVAMNIMQAIKETNNGI